MTNVTAFLIINAGLIIIPVSILSLVGVGGLLIAFIRYLLGRGDDLRQRRAVRFAWFSFAIVLAGFLLLGTVYLFNLMHTACI